jgi:hypothetical protein
LSEDRTFGINSIVLDRTIGKRFVEGVSGKGGLASLVMWMQQLDFITDIEPLLNSVSYKMMFYDTALTKCSKEALKRPEFMREEEIATLLGDVCVSCGKSYSIIGYSSSKCGKCGGDIESRYSLVLDELEKLDINPLPETVMMWVAYDGLAEAYVQAYIAFNKVLKQILSQRGWDNALNFIDAELKDRLDFSFYFGEPGDLRIASEERQILMFLPRGNLAGVGILQAEELIRLGIATVKFGHIFNQLFCAGADFQYDVKRAEFAALYNKVNEKIRLATQVNRKEREKRSIEVLELKDKQYYACSLLPDEFWKTGKLARNLKLLPLEKSKFPIFTDEESVAMNLLVAPSGAGKTTFMGGMINYAVDWAGEYVFNVMSDEKNGLSLAALPLFQCEGHTGGLLKVLKAMDVSAKPIPTLNLTFLRPGESIKKDKLPAHPATIFERIIEVDSAFSFGFDFYTKGKKVVESKGVVGNRGVLDVLEEFSLNLGYKRLCGLINVRNLLRTEKSEYEKETKPEIQIATNLINKFAAFRQTSKTPSARLYVDELSRIAGSQHNVAGTDTSKSSATFADTVKSMRGANTSVDGATQKYSEIQGEVKSEQSNVFFRELPKTGDKSRSQRDLVLDSLDLIGGKAEKELVSQMMESKAFPRDEHFWFWWNKLRGTIQVVRPNPPTFMLNQPKKTNQQIFRAFEAFDSENRLAKLFGCDSVLLDSWDDVPRLRYEEDSYFGKPSRRAA